MTSGEQIRRKRERKNISLRALARQAGISAAYLSDIELGRRRLNESAAEKIGAAYLVLTAKEATR